MTYNQLPPSWPQEPATRIPSAGLAISSLVLGIVGVVLSFMPLVNNLTAAGAFVGLVLGAIGIWKSRPWMSAIAVVLCGLAIMLTLVAQKQLSDEMDRIQDKFDRDTEQLERDLDACTEKFNEWDPASGQPAPVC
jgi:uncharacterized membrane protein